MAANSVATIGPNDLGVAFQPIVDLSTGAAVAVESLCRCRRPEFQSPEALFEAASEQGCSGQLGRTVREVSFGLCPDVALFVNVHPGELYDSYLVRPDDPLYFHDAPLFLEVTESAAVLHHEVCASVLREVCSRSGASLAVDDLGAGHSHLSRIIELEPAIVKIALQLTRGLDQRPRQRVLVRHLTALSAELGARVVAEGIESFEELSALIDCGVELGQGYLFAPPEYPIPAVKWPRGSTKVPPFVDEPARESKTIGRVQVRRVG